MEKCELCKREFKTRQGVAGHMRFKHPSNTGSEPSEDAAQLVTKRDMREHLAATQMTLEQHQQVLVSVDEGIDQMLEGMSGLASRIATITQTLSDHTAELKSLDGFRQLIGEPSHHPKGSDHSCESCSRYLEGVLADERSRVIKYLAEHHYPDIWLDIQLPSILSEAAKRELQEGGKPENPATPPQVRVRLN